MTGEIKNLQREEGFHTASRSRLYQLFSLSLRCPEEDFYEKIEGDHFAGELVSAMEGLPYSLPAIEENILQGLKEPGAPFKEFQVEFISLFEIGTTEPPCPLYEGVYPGMGPRKKVMEEVLRFYNFFDLGLSQERRELPDHITAELEFMHFLSFKETEAIEKSLDRGSYIRAQRDFLQRHLSQWLPKLHKRVKEKASLPFFVHLTFLLKEFINQDQAYLSKIATPP